MFAVLDRRIVVEVLITLPREGNGYTFRKQPMTSRRIPHWESVKLPIGDKFLQTYCNSNKRNNITATEETTTYPHLM